MAVLVHVTPGAPRHATWKSSMPACPQLSLQARDAIPEVKSSSTDKQGTAAGQRWQCLRGWGRRSSLGDPGNTPAYVSCKRAQVSPRSAQVFKVGSKARAWPGVDWGSRQLLLPPGGAGGRRVCIQSQTSCVLEQPSWLPRMLEVCQPESNRHAQSVRGEHKHRDRDDATIQ